MNATVTGARVPTELPHTRFELPGDHTATEPPEHRGLGRDGVRLLVAGARATTHTRFAHLGDHLVAGDVLVVNTSATLPGQLDGRRGAEPVVVHLGLRLGNSQVVTELRSFPDAAAPVLNGRAGEAVDLPGGAQLALVAPYPAEASPNGSSNRLWRSMLRTPRGLTDYLRAYGRPISYGYLRDRYPITCYQTIFGLTPGSAEMPSAGRPFSFELVTHLVSRGVSIAPITLHTGLSSPDAGEPPQPEWFEVNESSARLVNAAREHGGRIGAVGTRATRALESAAQPDGTVGPAAGWTDLVISPERGVRVVDGLITGWHSPEASHLLLVESVAGAALTQRAYDAAVAEHYLWHEFGDSCLLLP